MLSGFLFQIGGLFFEAYRLGLIQRLLSSENERLDPLVSLYYYSPCCAAMMLLVMLLGEAKDLMTIRIDDKMLLMLIANAAVAFLLNVTSVSLVSGCLCVAFCSGVLC